MWALAALSLFFLSACTAEHKNAVDRLNEKSYAFHYRDVDSTEYYALKALRLSSDYDDGRAEAYNNMAFACIVRMDYKLAYRYIDSVALTTDNQLELLIADIQGMRLCQRMSRNKEFYDYSERASARMKRVNEERNRLSERLARRFIYAKSEYAIVRSTYYYYVGLTEQSVEALDSISLSDVKQDTAQYLNYLYQVGSGGIVTGKSPYETCLQEFENLLECFLISTHNGYAYWEANSLQSISEHLRDREQRLWLTTNNPLAVNYINTDNMPDSLLAGYLAQKSLRKFIAYGDIYQIAGAYRTLASCYWVLGDYTSSLICLENALADRRITQAPDLVASIREQLSLTYSALDDKGSSDRNRNLYLDMQEKTRQDRQLEARAGQLERTVTQLNILAGFVLFLLIVVIVLIVTFRYMRRKKDKRQYLDNLLQPLRKWERINERQFNELAEKHEEINEALSISRMHIETDKKRNVDNRAKVFLAMSVTPYIDRIINEVSRLENNSEPEELRLERYKYVTELTDKINECNDVLTHWIQLQQGQLSIHVESFRLQDVFDIVTKAAMSFRLKGLMLDVTPTDAVVKADRVLTLFMLNTLADNSRKFTDNGGTVRISAVKAKDYVEVSVNDTGHGMTEAELADIFNRKVSNGHGFGLQNCRGIIDKYRKMSQIFNVCGLFAESEKGRGSRFFFRLPYGLARVLLCLTMFACLSVHAAFYEKSFENEGGIINDVDCMRFAGEYADSAYYSNVHGEYSRTLSYADKAISWLNECYRSRYAKEKRFLSFQDDGSDVPAEVEWFRSGADVDYNIILDIRNEAAVAALALHEWDVYAYNNKIYTQLFKEKSADSGLSEYCRTMQRSNANQAIAVVVLVLLLIAAVVSYYFLYYRHVLYFRFCVDNINTINGILLSDSDSAEKLRRISETDTSKYPKTLQNVINQIKDALQHSVDQSGRRLLNIELAADELHRADYEDAKLHVCNNITDNCLSTLKHETMYYPSRIRQLIDSPECDIHAVRELVSYYKELHDILNQQARNIADSVKFECRPVVMPLSDGSETSVVGDGVLIRYLLDIIQKQNGGHPAVMSVDSVNGRYVVLNAVCTEVRMTDEQRRNLFTPSVDNIPYLICRQIVRDTGEATNLHACGIVAEVSAEGLLLRLTLPHA